MINPDKRWFFWGISPKRDDYSGPSYIEDDLFGMCADHDCIPTDWKYNHTKFDPSKFGNCEVDIYLDLDEQELRMCVVGVNGDDNEYAEEAILYNISNDEGWVPHFNFASASINQQKIQIARVPLDWYGEKAEIQWIPK